MSKVDIKLKLVVPSMKKHGESSWRLKIRAREAVSTAGRWEQRGRGDEDPVQVYWRRQSERFGPLLSSDHLKSIPAQSSPVFPVWRLSRDSASFLFHLLADHFGWLTATLQEEGQRKQRKMKIKPVNFSIC
jgi:hypothetical protein